MEIKKPTVNKRQLDWEDMCRDEAVLLLNKGADYTAGQKDADAYANFRIISDLLKGAPITPYTIAMVYTLKHVLSLITFAKTGKQESGEGLRGRHMDLRNYVFILNELVADHNAHFSEVKWQSVREMVMANLEARETQLANEERLHAEHLKANAEFAKAAQDNKDKYFYFDKEYPYQIRDSEFLGNDGKWHPIVEFDNLTKEVDNTTVGCENCFWCMGIPIPQAAEGEK